MSHPAKALGLVRVSLRRRFAWAALGALCLGLSAGCAVQEDRAASETAALPSVGAVEWDASSEHVQLESLRREALGQLVAAPSMQSRFQFARASFPAASTFSNRLSEQEALQVVAPSSEADVFVLRTRGYEFRLRSQTGTHERVVRGDFVSLGEAHFLSRRPLQEPNDDASWLTDRLDEFWVADTAAGDRSATYELELPAEITTLRGTNDSFELFDSQGLPVLRFHGILARDARGHYRRGSVTLSGVEESGSAYRITSRRLGITVAISLEGLAPPVAIDPGWSTTSTMSMTRDRHTATLLPNGRVLVAGGNNGASGATATAELFDPSTGTWQSAGSMSIDRYGATATLLSTGKVLVTGGYSTSTAAETKKSDLYDPVGNTWSAVSTDMSTARAWHTATLLDDGRVLIAGGQKGSAPVQYVNTAEIFDPTKNVNQWSSAGTLVMGRSLHAAVPLPDRTVLLLGGQSQFGTTATGEYFNPTNSTWTPIGNMNAARSELSAVLLPTGIPSDYSGRVLVIGGGVGTTELYDPVQQRWDPLTTGTLVGVGSLAGSTATLLTSGSVLVTGGMTSLTDATNKIWVHNQQATSYVTQWNSPALNYLAAPRGRATATMLATGRVLVVGGQESATSWRNDAELYDPQQGTWGTKGNLPVALRRHTATSFSNGTVMIAGGTTSASGSLGSAAGTTSVYLYTPSTKVITSLNPLAEARHSHTATLLPDGRVLVAGGTSSAGPTRKAELFNPVTGQWTGAAWMTNVRWEATSQPLPDGRVLVAGGFPTAGTGATVEVYNPTTDAWSTGSMSTARNGAGVALLSNGKVLIAGGTTASGSPGSEVFDPTTMTSEAILSGIPPKAGVTLTRLANGKILAAGGTTSATPDDDTWLYDVSSGWSKLGAASKMNPGRKSHTALLLPNGLVGVFGGEAPGVTGTSALFDPATSLWTTTGSMVDARKDATTTLLADGTVMAIGGLSDTSTVRSTYELFDPINAAAAWKPTINASTVSVLYAGTQAPVTGSGFRKVSPASGSATRDSGTNFPVVTLMSLDASQIWLLPATGVSDTTLTVTIPNAQAGKYILTVIVNGISASSIAEIVKPVTQKPIALDQSVTTYEDSNLPITVTATNGTDFEWAYGSLTTQHGLLIGSLPTVTYRPDGDFNGSDSFTFTARYYGGGEISAPGVISITVLPVNDRPTMNVVSDMTISESAGQQSITLTGITAGPLDESGQTVTITATSDNTALVPNPSVSSVFGGIATLTFAAQTYAYGTANVTVTVKDSGGTANGGVDTLVRTFKITVYPVNDAPTLDTISDLYILQNAGPQAVALTGISPGPANESSQVLTLNVSSDNTTLLPTVTADSINNSASTIRFTPATNQFGTARVTVTLKDNGGTANGGIDTVTRSFRVVVFPVNQQPTINAINDVTVLENSGDQSIALSGISAGPPSEAAQQLTFTVTSDNPTLVPTPKVLAIANGSSQLTFKPATNEYGSSLITITLKDDGGTANGGVDTKVVTFRINVTAVNQPPTLRPLNDVTLPQNSLPLIVGVSGIAPGPANEASQTVTVTAVSDTPSVVPNPVVSIVSSSSATLSIQPAANQIGTAKITVTVKDNGGTANSGVDTTTVTFIVTVVPVNQAPTIDFISDRTVPENSGLHSVSLTGITPGPAIEAAQKLTITASSSNPSLIPNPAIGAVSNGTSTLSFTPATNQNGFAIISVRVQDDGGTGSGGQDTTTRTFVVTVTPFVNQAPTIDAIQNLTVAENSGPHDVALTGITPGSASEASQQLTITATSSNPALIPSLTVGSLSNGTATLSFTAAPNQNGFALVTVTVKDDGGTRNNGSDTTTRVFTVTVTAFVNQSPTIDPVAPLTVVESSGTQDIVLTGITPGPANEASQSLTITATSNTLGVIPDPTVSAVTNGSAKLTFTPVADQAGVVTFTVTVKDDGGTRNGGVDTTRISVVVVVASVNQPPTLDPVTDRTVLENAPTQTVMLTGISSGSATETAQVLSITAVSSDPSVIAGVSVGTLSQGAATLTFTPMPNAFGPATITVTVRDDGGTTLGGVDTTVRTFLVNVVHVNQPPTMELLQDQVIVENAPVQQLILRNLSPGPENESDQQLTITAKSSNPTLIPDPVITPGDITTLRFQPAFDEIGEASITVTVQDNGGTENGGADKIDLSFKVTVLMVNHVPTVSPIPGLAVVADAVLRQVKITGLSVGPDNESAQKLTITAVSEDTNVVTVHSVTMESDGTATLRISPVGVGTVSITVTVKDDGGIENGGHDTAVTVFSVQSLAARTQSSGCGCNGLDGAGWAELAFLFGVAGLLSMKRRRSA